MLRAVAIALVGTLAGSGCGPRKVPEPPAPTQAEPVDMEQVCPTADVAGYQVRRGEARGTNAGEAIAAAREQALQSLGRHVCAGVSELRCAATLRHVKPWRAGWFDAEGGWACASVSIDRRELDSLERDAAVFDTELRTLASAVVERVGREPVQIKAPTWASGCSSGEIGHAISAWLFNHLADFPELRLVPSEDRADRASRVRMTLAPSSGGVALSASLVEPGEATFSALPGFSFPLDLFVVDSDEAGACRSDRQLGLAKGERLGAGGLRVVVEVPGVDGEVCEGARVEPIVRVNRPAELQVYSVAQTGRSLLVWPPPGVDPLVDDTLSLGTMTAIAQPETGDERLVVVALPPGLPWGRSAGWHGFCEAPGGLGPEHYPDDAAVGTATFTVTPSGTRDCDLLAGIDRVRDQVRLPASCGQ